MHIQKFILRNYKSFLDSREIHLTPGFNVIVGTNNAGKTALSEGLGLSISSIPHKSLETSAFHNAPLDPTSTLEMELALSKQEVLETLARIKIFIRCSHSESPELAIEKFEPLTTHSLHP